ncbi:hypothetical protein PINS_up015274 [Pythium insidiosum]|nr:hypothetical protein PINS_up015274 [Pythium insidiosum]
MPPILTGESFANFQIEKFSMRVCFEDWQREIFLVLLDRIVMGEETIDDYGTPAQRQCFQVRPVKALATIVFALEKPEARKYGAVIENGDVVRLWRAIREDAASST